MTKTLTEEDKKWEEYLLSIGVVDLDNQEEINEKLDKVERANPSYEANIIEGLNEFFNTSEPNENIGKEEVRAWLESLGN